ncbi:MAG: transcriptional regulator [Proteobacteria bacterium]|nr:transcriptional regulator [Pseudomonadota bacterium]
MSRIVQGAREALAMAKGEADPSYHAVNIPETIDVRRIRKKLGMTQAAFAGIFGFRLATLRHWEQQRRIPEGPARAYLTVIDREPDAVRKALRAGE